MKVLEIAIGKFNSITDSELAFYLFVYSYKIHKLISGTGVSR